MAASAIDLRADRNRSSLRRSIATARSRQFDAAPRWTSTNPIPVPTDLALQLQIVPTTYETDYLVVSFYGEAVTPARLDVHFKRAAATVADLPDGFRLHDLRHFFALMLIAAGLDITTV
ncbi:hypothetical protein [uncultured Microbacterium sp.]|uniref:hypothetical protein n=1 Tax=uncultured Microbacterium sp. TaxID=191216 RepID=UPI0028D095A6|nr:hypothetical protein [uncultured Microbacterium sp.]